ncbi:DNA-processing protein DprA [Candidatus Saccharibacteria bacterium]|nr:DNA-processing protein DprA [Candidatus Saccharibacteria bacterium]
MSDAVVIVEASDHSGTLRTASYAADQGKDVYVVPGDLTRPMSQGCNILLRDACPFIGFEDFALRALHMNVKIRKRNNLAPDERRIVEQIKLGLRSGDEIAQKLDISSSKFNQIITLLELKNVVCALGCNQWTLV